MPCLRRSHVRWMPGNRLPRLRNLLQPLPPLLRLKAHLRPRRLSLQASLPRLRRPTRRTTTGHRRRWRRCPRALRARLLLRTLPYSPASFPRRNRSKCRKACPKNSRLCGKCGRCWRRSMWTAPTSTRKRLRRRPSGECLSRSATRIPIMSAPMCSISRTRTSAVASRA